MKNKIWQERESGITLIALVITIIILLILAGIGINFALGEHGILNLAKNAKNEYENAEKREDEAFRKYQNEIDEILNRDVPANFLPVEGEGDGTGTTMSIQAKTTAKYGIKEYQYYLNGEYVSSTTEEEFIFDHLTPFIEYRTYVIAVDNKGNKKKSGELTFCTGQYLFKDGNEYSEITGGWRGVYTADGFEVDSASQYYGNGFFNKDNNQLNFGDRTDAHGEGGFKTNNSINLKNYKKIGIKGTYSSYFFTRSGYPEAFVGLSIDFGNLGRNLMQEKVSKNNAQLNYEYVFSEAIKGKEIENLGICAHTGWNSEYQWYGSISEIYMLK